MHYKRAIEKLNQLQQNHPFSNNFNAISKLQAFKSQFSDLGYNLKDLDKLNIIHVTGTKGKGSVCMFAHNILKGKFQDLKIGLFTSPHLMEARERIRINGFPISQENFAKEFNHCYELLKPQIKNIGYFQFITLLGFHVFIKNKVDALVLEVGIGGTYDFTNIIKSPVVCGITKVDFDHQNVLGNSIVEISNNKGGIIKNNSVCISSYNQKDEAAMELLRISRLKKATLKSCLKPVDLEDENMEIGIDGSHQKENAMLGLHLAHEWSLKIKNVGIIYESKNNKFIIDQKTKNSIANTKWLGRSYLYKKNDICWYLDGAHTLDSLEHAFKWFAESCKEKEKILVFNVAQNRDYKPLVELILKIQENKEFDKIIFVPNILEIKNDPKAHSHDCFSLSLSEKDDQQEKMIRHFIRKKKDNTITPLLKKSIRETVEYLINKNTEKCNISVFVTGSLKLVGGFMSVLKHPVE